MATLAVFSLLRDKGTARLGYAGLGCAGPGQLLSNTEESIFGRSTSVLRDCKTKVCPLSVYYDKTHKSKKHAYKIE